MWTPLSTHRGRWSHYIRKAPELPPLESSGRSLMPTHKPTCPHALEKKRPGHQATTRFPSSAVSELPLTPQICFISASAADRMIVKLSLREHGKWCSPTPVHPPKGSEYTGIIFLEHPVAQRLSKVPEGLQSTTLSSVHGWLNHSLAIPSGQLGP